MGKKNNLYEGLFDIVLNKEAAMRSVRRSHRFYGLISHIMFALSKQSRTGVHVALLFFRALVFQSSRFSELSFFRAIIFQSSRFSGSRFSELSFLELSS